jgi:Uma2 family endonuclease
MRREFEWMVEQGLFSDERVELLHGELVQMTPQGARHAEAVSKLDRLLNQRLGDRGLVRAQMPFAAGEIELPEPDIAVVPLADYRAGHPSRAFLIVEVADSSRRKDRKVKPAIYAAANVPEYWLVDLIDELVEVRTRPSGGHYEQLATLRRGDVLRPGAFADIEVPVAVLLP